MSESVGSPWQQTSLLPLVATPTASAEQLLILDTETTGLNAEVDQVLEVGAILSPCPSVPFWRSSHSCCRSKTTRLKRSMASAL